MKDLPKVENIMSRKVVSFDTSFTTIDALKAFNKYRISSAPVMDLVKNEVVGFITDYDCMNAIANNSFFNDFRNVSIQSAMKTDVKSLSPSKSIYEAEAYLKEHNLKHTPIIDEDNKLVGILSRRDILKALEKIVDDIQLQKEKSKAPKEFSSEELNRFRVLNR